MKAKLLKLKEMMSPGFDWGKHNYSDYHDIDYLFSECYKLHDYKKEGNRPIGTRPCGSAGFEDTPKTIYRALYLLKPESVDFSDMYKSETLLEIVSPDYHFRASMQFYKYEIALYFECHKDAWKSDGFGIVCGMPGADNGYQCTDEVGNLWFAVLTMVLNYKHSVYPGNDFEV